MKNLTYFNDRVKPLMPNIELGKLMSAREIGLDKYRHYDHPDSKSFKCSELGITSFKGKDPKFTYWSDIIGDNFMEWVQEQKQVDKPKRQKTGGRKKGSLNKEKSPENIGMVVPKEQAKDRIDSIGSNPKTYFIYRYLDEDGGLLQIKTRHKQNKRDQTQYCWDGSRWQKKGYVQNGMRPLYGLHKLQGIEENDPIVVVEGEKATEALWGAGYAALGVPGCNMVGKMDLSPLRGKRIIIWPDNDEQGDVFTKNLTKKLEDFRVINNCKIEELIAGTLNPSDDAADRTVEEIKSIVSYADALFESELSDRDKLRNFVSCFYQIDALTYYVPKNVDLAAMQGRNHYNGSLTKIEFSKIPKWISSIHSIGGVINRFGPNGGPDPFKFYKEDKDGELHPSILYELFLQLQKEFWSEGDIQVSPLPRMMGSPAFVPDDGTTQNAVYPQITPFIQTNDSYADYLEVEHTQIYKIIEQVMGDNTQVFIQWLSRYIAAYASGTQEILNRLPIMCILGAPAKGKSAIVSIINAIHKQSGAGDLIKYALDSSGFGSSQLLKPFLVADDPNTNIDRNFSKLLRSACKNIQTGMASTIEKKGVDSFTGDFRRMAMIVSNTDEVNVNVLRDFCDEDMKKRTIFLTAQGKGLLHDKTNEQASMLIAKLIRDAKAIEQFAGALWRSYEENKDIKGYIKTHYMSEECKDIISTVSPDMEIEAFLKWFSQNFSKDSIHYLECLEHSGPAGKFVYHSKNKGYSEVRLPMNALRELYRYYRDTVYSGEKSSLTRYLLGDNDDDRGAISPLSKADTIRNVCAGLQEFGITFEKAKFHQSYINCVCFKEPIDIDTEPEIKEKSVATKSLPKYSPPMTTELSHVNVAQQDAARAKETFIDSCSENKNNILTDSQRLRNMGIDESGKTIWAKPK